MAPLYSRKISLDNESSHSSRNDKLEEFKRVVEHSYNQHVLHKPPAESKHSSFSRQSSLNSETNAYQNIFIANGTDVSSSLQSFSHEPPPPAPPAPVKLQYMSAYNVYNSNEATAPQGSARINHFEALSRNKLDLNEGKPGMTT